MSDFITRYILTPTAAAMLSVGVHAYGFVHAVQRGDWLAAAGYGTALSALYLLFLWWRRARRAWWWSPEYQARHTDFVDRLTNLTHSGPYIAWNIRTRQWIAVIAPTPPWSRPGSVRWYFEIVVEDSPEPSFAPGRGTEFDFVTTRRYGVFRENPRVDIDVTAELVDPHTGDRRPVADAEQNSDLRALLRRLRTPAAARLASTRDIDALLDLLDEAEPREH
ncbi:hypothetical protein [Nocardia sp. AG03]|uniref:hypothetical protein n=1 Tax=Nocardia sp. AG03 TaxID=3025312 RepID=UPI00241829E5|nr:hypothetical protein [Nocardia sp. AG03]